MIIETFTITTFQQNTRVVVCEDTKKAVCIDPGERCDEIADFINENDFELQAITLNARSSRSRRRNASICTKHFPKRKLFCTKTMKIYITDCRISRFLWDSRRIS